MKFDRNTVIGFVILGILFIGMFYYNNREQAAFLAQKKKTDEVKRVQDSSSRAQDSITHFKNTPQTTVTQTPVPTAADSTGFLQALNGTETEKEVSTGLLRILFTNKGGRPKLVELKSFKGPDSAFVKLGSSAFDKLTYKIALAPNQTAGVDSLYF